MTLHLLKNIARSLTLRDATDEEIKSDAVDLRFAPSFQDGSKTEFAILFDLRLTFEGKFLAAEYLTIFETSEEFSDDFPTSNFVKMNAPAIAFPFIRSYVAHITLIAGYSPVVLPSVNFVEITRSGELIPKAAEEDA